jgi:hypothetical protein
MCVRVYVYASWWCWDFSRILGFSLGLCFHFNPEVTLLWVMFNKNSTVQVSYSTSVPGYVIYDIKISLDLWLLQCKKYRCGIPFRKNGSLALCLILLGQKCLVYKHDNVSLVRLLSKMGAEGPLGFPLSQGSFFLDLFPFFGFLEAHQHNIVCYLIQSWRQMWFIFFVLY